MKKMTLSTGIASLDSLLDGVRLGDNVVWYVSSMEEYVSFVKPFVQHCLREGFKTVYVSIDNSLGDLMDRDKVEVFDASKDEHPMEFKRRLLVFIKKRGLYVHYIFDNLTALKERWKDDDALADFFQTICPILYELDTVTYFSIRKGAHKDNVIAKIRDTTQILIDVDRVGEDIYIQPLKVWDRYATDMFRPHVFKAGALKAVKELDVEGYTAQLEEKIRELDKIKNTLRESEEALEKYKTLFSQINDLAYVCDAKGDILFLNETFEKLTDHKVEEFIGKPFATLFDDENLKIAMDMYTRTLNGESPQYELRFKDTGVLCEYKNLPLRDEKGDITGVMGIARDITEHKKAEEEIRLLQTITHVVSDSQDYRSALEIALRKVCEATGWSYGEAWIPSSDGTVLECGSVWHEDTKALKKFRLISEKTTFPPDTGLPGRIWLSKQPEWLQDVSSEPDTIFLRASAAIKSGLKASFGVPITINEEVLAVLVFFMYKSRRKDKRLVELVSAVAAQLGSVVQRRQAEEALQESEEQHRTLVESSTDAIISINEDGMIILWNEAAEDIFGYSEGEAIGKPVS